MNRHHRIVFITGRQGSGKSLIANDLAAKHGFAHLDGDHWSCREDVKKMRTALCESMINYNGDFAEGEESDEEKNQALWKPFYAAMCQEAIRMSQEVSPNVLLISHSLFRRSQRAFVAQQLGKDCLFLVVASPSEIALQRAAERTFEQYKAMCDYSVDKWKGMLRINSAGFQEFDSIEFESERDVINAVVVYNEEETTKAGLLQSAEALLGLSSSSSSSNANE